ncbi:MAG: pilus assembly protein [Anaerolineales bacterium]|nr:pilus assembly protein [Anaerolineales bacterium]
MKRLFYRLRLKAQHGQSLVEMAITAPILIFLLLGVFEVGWALRGYLVLTNVNREITRFAIRPGYLDYSVRNNTITSATTVGYSKVLSYVYTTLSDQLPLDFSTGQTATLIISHIVADTGLPFSTTNKAAFDCSRFVTQPNFYLTGTDVFTADDLILHPGLPGYEYFYAYTFPMTSTYRTKINYAAEAAKLARENNKFNCELMKKSSGTLPAANNIIITEMYYNQPQLFGFPIIANPYTNPVPMYAHTAMRMIVASRSGENVDTVGPICYAMPFTVRDIRVAGLAPGQIFDVLHGYPDTSGVTPKAPGTDDRGFLAWDPQWDNVNDLRFELLSARTSFNSYTNARVPGDKTLNVGDWVASLSGNNGGALDQIQYWVGKGPIVVPVWDQFQGPPPPSVRAAWHISTFIRVELLDQAPYAIDLTGNDPKIYARYIEPAYECINN